MSARTLIVDSGGATRKAKRWALVDSGGTSRLAKRVFLVDSGGAPRLVFSSEDDLTMVTAVSGNVAGYTFAGFGSMTPTNLGDGARVDSLLLSSAVATPVPNQMQLFLEGYPGTITGAYIASISINGTFMPMSGADFSFSGGTPGGSAQFTWRNQGGVYSATHGGFSIPVVIVRS